MPGIIQIARRPEGWRAPGPPPTGTFSAPRDDEDLCYLAGDWRIFQKQRGHRWSLDDLVTAWFATMQVSQVGRHVDLGCGIGSVLQLIAWRFPQARSIGVEAQAVSAELARRSVAFNGAADRVEVREGDLRDPSVLGEGAVFDLVTGTPPYFDLAAGTLSERVQAVPCRFETRGGIEVYCEAAARLLAPGGVFVVCEASLCFERAYPAARANGLVVEKQLDVIPREGKAPLVTVFAMRRAAPEASTLQVDRATVTVGDAMRRSSVDRRLTDDEAAPRVERTSLTVRDRAGRRTPEFVALRDDMGMPP